MTRAEERALEAYPVKMGVFYEPDIHYEADLNLVNRKRYLEGYIQAEKDSINRNINQWVGMKGSIPLGTKTSWHDDPKMADGINALEKEIERYEEELHGFESSTRADCINIARHFYDFGKLSHPKQSYNCEKLEDEVVNFWNSHALDFRLRKISVMDLLNMCAKHFAEWRRMRMVDEKLEDAK